MSVLLSVPLKRSAGMPGPAPRACPKDMPRFGHASKRPRRGPEGATTAAGRKRVLEGGEGGTPPKKFPPKKFLSIFPEGATAVAGRQGVLVGGRDGGKPPKRKFPPKQIFSSKIFSRGDRGSGGGRGYSPNKIFSTKFVFP